MKFKLLQSTERVFQLEEIPGEKLALLDRVIAQRDILAAHLCDVEEKGSALEAQFGASKAEEKRLRREKDKVVSNLRDFEIHVELTQHVIFLEFDSKRSSGFVIAI